MNKALLEIALKMNIHVATLLDEDSAEYFIIDEQREILQLLSDGTPTTQPAKEPKAL